MAKKVRRKRKSGLMTSQLQTLQDSGLVEGTRFLMRIKDRVGGEWETLMAGRVTKNGHIMLRPRGDFRIYYADFTGAKSDMICGIFLDDVVEE